MDKDSATVKAAFSGKITLGDIVIDCAVLDNGVRVLSERAVSNAIGTKRGGSHWRRLKESDSTTKLPVYISAKNLHPYISPELQYALNNPILYRTQKSGAIAHGLEATLLPQICDVWLKARDADALVNSQKHIAVQADMLMRALAHVGIIALVDEATGYQEVRDRHALEKILEAFIAKELASWTKQFPNEFYKEIFRLKGWRLPLTGKRPGVVGYYTNDLVYDRLAPGVLEELKRLTPKTPKGNRKHKYHQLLSKEVGHPKLAEHLSSLIVLMKASVTWDGFYKLAERALPRFGSSIPLFDDDTY
ncbi:P63C domain-containing protein [Sporomusa sphaeroides DSM 2875]|uniref:P63C domain-containing protein n=1 Tax=Sporomusa sphaeroides TaxID=47679 RepID=UPI00202E790A|nr:P63C domain-containing protein [Sporomusa sphaeroides]MCM0758463.1 P63C domain-containing protein [Sporomusa sphaeroides DSM 2875]